MASFRFDLVFNEDANYRRMGHQVQACCCHNWRSVRVMLRYYGHDKMTVFKVRWQPSHYWKHSDRKPTPREVAAYLATEAQKG